jgi:signal transduction histidine kinase
LRDEDHAFTQDEARPKGIARPGEDRIPVLRLLADQAVGIAGAIADEIRAEIFRDLLRDRRGIRRDTVDDRIGEPRERHGGGVDALALRLPLGGDRRAERPHRRRQRAAGRRLHGAAVEQHRVRRPLTRLRGRIESLAQVRAHVAPRRLDGIERLIAEQVFENVAHEEGLSASQGR